MLAGLPGHEGGTDEAKHTRHALHALVCLGPPTAHARKVPALLTRVAGCGAVLTSPYPVTSTLIHRHSLLNQLAPTIVQSFTVLRPVRQSQRTWIGTAVQQSLHALIDFSATYLPPGRHHIVAPLQSIKNESMNISSVCLSRRLLLLAVYSSMHNREGGEICH